MTYKEKNVFNQLFNKYMDCYEQHKAYQKQCVNVELNGSVCIMELRWLHNIISEHFPELVSSRRTSDGGSNKMTLIAKPDEIKAALELILSEYPKINSSSLHIPLKEIIDTLEPQKTIKLFPQYR